MRVDENGSGIVVDESRKIFSHLMPYPGM